MKLRLNLSTTPIENKRPFLAGTMLVGTVAALTLVALSHAAYRSWRANHDVRIEISQWQAELHKNQRKQQELATYFRAPQVQQVLDRARFLNSLIDERSFPWTKIFMDLERTLPPGVRVVKISPRLEKGRVLVQLTVGAADDTGKLKFLKSLELSKVFSEIRIQQERHVEQAGATDRVLLELEAWYSTT